MRRRVPERPEAPLCEVTCPALPALLGSVRPDFWESQARTARAGLVAGEDLGYECTRDPGIERVKEGRAAAVNPEQEVVYFLCYREDLARSGFLPVDRDGGQSVKIGDRIGLTRAYGSCFLRGAVLSA